jgi:hypothetical protein
LHDYAPTRRRSGKFLAMIEAAPFLAVFPREFRHRFRAIRHAAMAADRPGIRRFGHVVIYDERRSNFRIVE